MYKKIAKTQEQTDKKFEDKNKQPKDIEVVLRKIKDRNNNNKLVTRTPRVLHDRGDSKNTKGDIKFKYDSSKINRATEVNAKSIKAETIINISKNGTAIRKMNELNTIIGNDKDCPVDGSKLNCVNLRTENKEKVVEDKKILEKEPQIKKKLGRNDRIGTEKNKENDQNKTKIKEVITIPYLPAEDSFTQIIDEDVSEPIKPIIKSVTSKQSSKVLSSKTVTFKNQHPKLSPKKNENKDAKLKTASNFRTKNDRNKTKTSTTVKGQRRKRFSTSSVKCVINEFPPTEVVKWEPSCLTSQTQPYYEAWVDTTLTAFSKYSDEEKLLLEKDLIKALQYLKRPVSPELVYERLKDERYTGRIRIRRK